MNNDTTQTTEEAIIDTTVPSTQISEALALLLEDIKVAPTETTEVQTPAVATMFDKNMLNLEEGQIALHATVGNTDIPVTPEIIKEYEKQHTPKPPKQPKPPVVKEPIDLSRLLEWDGHADLSMYRSTQKPALLSSPVAKNYLKSVLHNLITPDTDGHDHINISYMGMTRFGKMLEVNALAPFIHPQIGKFNSLGSLWYYILGDQDDRFRSMHGTSLRNAARNIEKRPEDIEGFRIIIADATWLKVIQSEEMVGYMTRDKPLPFRSYYINRDTEMVEFTPFDRWYVDVLTVIRNTLITNSDMRYAKQVELSERAKNGENITKDIMTTELQNLPFILPDFSFLDQPVDRNRKGNNKRHYN